MKRANKKNELTQADKKNELKKAIETISDILLTARERKLLIKCASKNNSSVENVALAGLFTGVEIAIKNKPDKMYLERFQEFLSRIEFDYTTYQPIKEVLKYGFKQ